jgi:hypothetical protein
MTPPCLRHGPGPPDHPAAGPVSTATVSTTGSARSAPTTCRTCTPSRPVCNATAPQCSTA